MKIKRLQIHGFGKMKDQDIQFSSPVTVLAGPNEAGKSTVLQFVRSMLYGIPSRAYPAERYEPPGGGRHGGVLTAESDDGSIWTVSRHASADQRAASGRAEQLSIVKTTPQGAAIPMTQSDLERELLGGMSRDMFKQLFAVTLTELQEIRTLQSEEMNSYLFHAGFGGGGEIMRAERKLIQGMEKLYKPRGRVQESAKVLQAIEQLQREIAESRSYLGKYMEAEERLLEADRNLKESDNLREAASGQLAILRKALEIRPQWLAWKEAAMERDALPEPAPFPEEGIQRWQRLQEDQTRVELRLQELEHSSEECVQQLNLLPLDERLIGQGPLIDKLASRREYVEMRLKEQQELSGEASALTDQLQRLLRQIHAGWETAELREFSGSVSEREAVRRYAAGFAGYDRRMEVLAQEREQKTRQLESAELERTQSEAAYKAVEEAGRERFRMFIPQTRSELMSAWTELQLESDNWRETRLSSRTWHDREEREALVRQGMKALYGKLLWGSAAFTLILPAVLWLLHSVWGAAAAFLLLIVADIMLWRGSRASTDSRRVRRRREPSWDETNTAEERISKRMAALVNHPLAAAASEAGEQGRGSSQAAEIMESSLRELRKLVDARLSWQDELDRTRIVAESTAQRSDAMRYEVSALAGKMDEEQRFFTDLDAKWRRWLTERKLPESCSPETVMDMFVFAEQGMELVRRLDMLERKQEALTQEIVSFEKECRQIAEDQEVYETGELLRLLELRKTDWERQQHLLRQKEAIRSKLEPMQAEIFRLNEEKGRLERAALTLLEEARALDGESFLRAGAAVERGKELDRIIRQLEISMFSGWSGDRLQALRDTLEQMDAAALEEAFRQASESLEQADQRWNGLQQQRGRLLQERDQLVKLCAHDTALQQLEEQRSLLKEITAEYAVLSLCAELIASTRSVYERDKQPEVLKLASAYFQELTRGSYSRIVMKIGEKKLLAEHRDSGLIDSSILSRGTAEQLYLAMRFAFASSMKDKALVPLLLDDLFVNFDEDRMCAALDLTMSMSRDRQIIMLTCHRYVAEQAMHRIPGAEVIRI